MTVNNQQEMIFNTNKPKFIDLFAGIGGFRIGFEKAGYECVFSSEIDDDCREVYKNNFKDVPFGDITLIDTKKIPNFDILLAGFPCQPFSICGKKRGFEDIRGNLFFDICRIAYEKKPQVIVLENVKHLIHHDKGKTLSTILQKLEELQYTVSFELLNSKDFGLPQNRERIVIIASSKSIKFDFNLLEKKSPVKLESFLDQNDYFDYLPKNEYTLLKKYTVQKTGLIFVGYRNKNIWKTGIRPNTEHLSRVHRQPNRIYSVKGTHPTLPSQETSGRFFIYLPEQNEVRKLTISECYRIMGFPEKFQKSKSISAQYKQIGNSVCIPMIEAIAQQIKKQKLIRV